MKELEKNAEKLAYKWWHGIDKEFVDVIDAYVQGYKDAIKNACEWIEKFAYNSVVTDNIGEREKQAIIISFKEYMEEQQ